VLTNKPGRISSDIIAALGLASLFPRVYGGDMLTAKKPDPVGILTLMNDTGAGTDETLMIGDSSVDIQTARNAKVRSCGALWGFQPESFDSLAPDLIVSRPRDLPQAIASLENDK
jgi:phosphoglycolate phosphatase